MKRVWRTARVFLSSTFLDMHAERDHLVSVVFPRLRERLLPFRVDLYDIDLRWGITRQEAEDDRVVPFCLEQVDECRPFFLGMLGHRYGWRPAQGNGLSLTHMEINRGVFEGRSRALFCLRMTLGWKCNKLASAIGASAQQIGPWERGGVPQRSVRTWGRLAKLADVAIAVPCEDTQHIQEAHLAIEHLLCLLVEQALFGRTAQ